MIGYHSNIALNKQRLIWSGKELYNDNDTLYNIGITHQNTIHLVSSLNGGDEDVAAKHTQQLFNDMNDHSFSMSDHESNHGTWFNQKSC